VAEWVIERRLALAIVVVSDGMRECRGGGGRALGQRGDVVSLKHDLVGVQHVGRAAAGAHVGDDQLGGGRAGLAACRLPLSNYYIQ
jgi:hypothetical protein